MNVYLPSEAVTEEPRRRFMDWRFLAALAALLMIAFLVWAGFRNYEIREAEAAQKDALISQLAERADELEALRAKVDQLHAQSREDRKAWRAERRDARRERAKLIRQQETMLRLLRRYGAPRVIVQRTRESKESDSAAVVRTSDPLPPLSRTPPPRPPLTTSTAPKPAPEPTAGKSGKTPKGKAKGLH